jgi:hypothetical protein
LSDVYAWFTEGFDTRRSPGRQDPPGGAFIGPQWSE